MESVSSDILSGCPNLPTTNSSLSSLYKPTVVMYGLNKDPVAKFAKSSDWWDLIFLADIFNVSLNSSSPIVH